MIGNLAEIIQLKSSGRPLSQLNLARLPFEGVIAAEKLLASTPIDRRHEIPGLDVSRADVLLPACIVLRKIMERLKIPEFTVSDKAIRDGLLYDFMERHREGIQAESEIPNLRRREVIRLARRCQYDPVHTHHVAKLCLQMFDQTTVIHQLGESERECLEYSAVLHDIGYLINSRQHHKHSYYLIKNSDLAGFTAAEIELIGNVARYHRKAPPETDHRTVKDLPAEYRETLTVLAGILRLANALDGSHFGVVRSIECAISGKAVEFTLVTNDDAALEVWAGQRRSDILADAFNREIILTPRVAAEAQP